MVPQLIQATRRLYRPPGQHLTLGQIVELNKRFIAGYEVYKDEPKLKKLSARVKEYNTLLRYMGLKDHQVRSFRRRSGAHELTSLRRSSKSSGRSGDP